ncbi:MAG: glycosyltransferase [Candidatus Krumholzibacteriia bacterium]
MKKLLMIAYDFPPAANVGIYRSVKFARYLPEFGWQGVVLTVRNGKHAKYDDRMNALIPDGTRVYRARSFEALNTGENRANRARSGRRTFGSRVYNRLCRLWAFFMIPDDKVTWVPAATWLGYRAVKREGIGHVYVSGKPFSSFLIGYLLKKLCGIKLVIDYRDPWTQNINYVRRSPFHAWVERTQERAMVRASDLVIANTRINEEMMVRDFGEGQPRDKFVSIHNGFDSEDFKTVPPGRYDKFSITYAGAFYFTVGSSWRTSAGDDVMKTYSPMVFFQALEKFAASRPDVRDHLRVNFMGVVGRGYEPVVREMGLEGIVHHLGYLDYGEHLAVLKKSHVMLLVLSRGEKSRGWIPSKFFSYLGSGNPVLALVPEGEVRDIIEAARAGIIVEPDDVDGTVDALSDLYDRYLEGGAWFDRDEERIQRFERRFLAGLLAGALDRI